MPAPRRSIEAWMVGCAGRNASGPKADRFACQTDTTCAGLNVQALGEDSAAQQYKHEASEVLQKLTAAVPPEGPLRAKYMGLQAFMQQVR